MNCPRVPLRELCQFRHGGTPSKSIPEFWTGIVPWVSPKDMKSHVVEDSTDHITEDAVRGSATSIVLPGSVLVVVRSGILAHTLPVAKVARPLAFNQDIKAVVPVSDRADPDYLYWFLRSAERSVIEQGVKKGATVHSVQAGFIENLRIPVPSLDEQRRIVDILSRAEGIVRLRREAQKKTAELVPAIFLEMFGDPATNPKRWPVVQLGEILSAIDSGYSPKCHDRPRENDEWGVLRLGAVSRCEYDEGEHKTLPSNLAVDPTIEVRPGDLLLSRKNTAALVGASAYVWTTASRMLLPDLIFRLRVANPRATEAIYLWKLLTSDAKRRALTRLASGSAGSMPNISKERLRNMLVEVPPYELQVRFCERVRQVRSISAQQTDSLSKAVATLQTLLSCAFGGGLDAASQQRAAVIA
ncbi:MAG: restriction endonuclease subunit S [Burkholderiaceae bacterium]